jgi:hypothetical protein
MLVKAASGDTLTGMRSPRGRNGKLSIPIPFDEAMKAALEAEPPKDVEKAKKARVASRTKGKSKKRHKSASKS